jgi:anti-anti-sigma factor
MKIEATREGGSAVLRLDGRLDREWAEQLSNVLGDLLRDGVRRLVIDVSMLTYISSAATQVLSRWQQELAVLRGEMELTSVSPAVREMLATMGWSPQFDAADGAASGAVDFRQSSWQTGPNLASSGNYQTSSSVPNGTLSSRLHGNPARLGAAPFEPHDCEIVNFPSKGFGLGVGAIGRDYGECHERFGEIIGVAGCLAHFPSDGTRLPDYLVGDGSVPPGVVLATGITCQGEFSRLVRFSSQPDAEAVPLSELAAVCLEASGSSVAGLVIAGETAGLSGARLRRSPAGQGTLQFEVPAVREWLTFAPERTYSLTTTLIAGVAARSPKGPLAGHLRPLGRLGKLYGHFHAAVFSYRPLPQRTVELGTLLRRLFKEHELRDVLHLVWDDRGEDGVGESALLRGVGWVAPITQVS